MGRRREGLEWLLKRRKGPQGDLGPEGDQGDKGQEGPQGIQGIQGEIGPPGEQGLDGMPNVTSYTSSPGRTLNTTFRPHVTRPTMGIYTLSITASPPIGGSVTGTVELLSDSFSPPTTVRAKIQLAHGLGAGVLSNTTQMGILMCLVPPGHYIKLSTSGSGTIALVVQTEIVM